MHLHIIGIGGTFMGGLAQIARSLGHRVTGCDQALYSPMKEQLEAAGIEVTQGYEADQLDAVRPDEVVVGNVARRGLPVVEALLNHRRLPYTSGPEWLGRHVLQGRPVVAVAGTHGKTTTTAWIVHVLETLGLEPGYLVGGVPIGLGLSARPGRPDAPFVIEADEYDTAFFDKRSKFLHYPATVAVLNNLEFDHADIFPDLAAIERQFHHWIRCLPSNGRLVVNRDSQALARVLEMGSWTPVTFFEGESAEPWAGCPLAGRHNGANQRAVVAAVESLGLDATAVRLASEGFQGVKRRLELLGEPFGVAVYDDFAHHPTAIQTTLEGLRARRPAGRVLAVFEPRSNTMKLGTLRAALPGALRAADHAFGHAGGLDWDLAEALAPMATRASVLDDLEALAAAVVAEAQPGDAVLVMSNGSFGGLHGRLLQLLAARAEGAAA